MTDIGDLNNFFGIGLTIAEGRLRAKAVIKQYLRQAIPCFGYRIFRAIFKLMIRFTGIRLNFPRQTKGKAI
jgi:hypothetical protein